MPLETGVTYKCDKCPHSDSSSAGWMHIVVRAQVIKSVLHPDESVIVRWYCPGCFGEDKTAAIAYAIAHQ